MKDSVVRRNPNVLEQDLGAELLLYTLEGEAVHVLNATGRAVWRLCDGEHTIEAIALRLRASFIQPDQQYAMRQDGTGRDRAGQNIVTDVQRMVSALAERGLLMEEQVD